MPLRSDHVIERIVLGMDIWPILALFGVVVLVIATFISHTLVSPLLSISTMFTWPDMSMLD